MQKAIILTAVFLIFTIIDSDAATDENIKTDEDRIKDLQDAVKLESAKANIAIILAIATGAISFVFSLKTEWFKSKLSRTNKEHAAKVDYQYDALKELYKSARPILFQIYQSSDTARRRIRILVRLSRLGLVPTYLNYHDNRDDDFVIGLLVYQLLVPLAYFRLLEQKITLSDLRLDRNIELVYELTKKLFFSFTSDFYVSKYKKNIAQKGEEPKYVGRLRYSPYKKDGEIQNEEVIQRKPRIFSLQGLRLSQIYRSVNALIEWDRNDSIYKVISLDEFQKKLSPDTPNTNLFKDTFNPVLQLFLNFKPNTKPVLWRILTTQYLIHTVLESHYKNSENHKMVKNLLDVDMGEMVGKFDWRSREDRKNITDEKIREIVTLDFEAANHYIKRDIEELLGQELKDPFSV